MCLKNYKIISSHKLQAFTLAEVLVTLVIIAVISALTIPALLTNIREAQYKVAWKKAYSDISQATRRIVSDNGGTLAFSNSIDVMNKYSLYLSSVKVCSGASTPGNCWHFANEWQHIDGQPRSASTNYGFLLGNGALLGTWTLATACDTVIGTTTYQECGKLMYDVNGFRGPNTVGKDIFAVHLLPDRVLPTGIPNDWAFITEEGWSVSADYLKQ